MNLDNFSLVSKNRDKFNQKCKKCQKIKQEGYYAKTREHQIKKSAQRNKENAEQVSAYHRELYKSNPDYFKNNFKRNFADNPELYKRNQKRWRQENREKVRHYSSIHRVHDVSEKEYQAMLKVFNNSCAYCGITAEEHKKKFNERLHNEHVEDDGYNDLRNDIPACKSCNCSKRLETMEDWFRKQSFFNEEKLKFIQWWTSEGYKDYIEDKPPYRYSRSRVYNSDGSYSLQHELWTVDEKRNMLECIATADRKKNLIIPK